jgi:hypothetical protein
MTVVEPWIRDPFHVVATLSLLLCVVSGLVIVLRKAAARWPTATGCVLCMSAIAATVWCGKEAREIYTELLRADDELRVAHRDLRQAHATLQTRHDQLTRLHDGLRFQHGALAANHEELQTKCTALGQQVRLQEDSLLAFRTALNDYQAQTTAALTERDANTGARLNNIEARFERERQLVDGQLEFNRAAIKALAPADLFEERDGVTLFRQPRPKPEVRPAITTSRPVKVKR